MDKVSEILIAALKDAVEQPGPALLFKSGKHAGLFSSRSGSHGEAAHRAVEEGLLELTRKETTGKTDGEWVRVTPRGVQFVYEQESPKAVLEELVKALRIQREGLPEWLAEIRAQMQAVANRFGELVERQCEHLDRLATAAEQALRRVSNGIDREAGLSGWQLEALAYLDQRRALGAGECTLPELFHFIRQNQHDVSIGAFHEGLAELQDKRFVELLPHTGNLKDLAEPEHALVQGAAVYYSVRRK